MNQVVRHLPSEVSETPSVGEQGLSFNLSERVQQRPLLCRKEEARIYQSMSREALQQLLLMTEHEALLTELKWLIDTIEEEVRRYESAPGKRAGADTLNLVGLIDELEMLHFINDSRRFQQRKKRLHRRLSDWNPPRYIVHRLVEQLMTDTYSSTECPRLKESRRRILKAQRGYQRSRNTLTDANLRLVFSVANRFRYLGLPYEDLVQEGSLGLIKAIERFEHKKGFLFSTYAYRVISQAIHLAVERNEHLVRRPYKQIREKAVVDQTRMRLEQRLGRALRGSDLDKHLPESLEYRKPHIENNVQSTASAWLPSSTTPDQDHEALSSDRQSYETLSLSYKQMISRGLDSLDERSALIVRLRYGIGVAQNYTLKEISERLSLSSERVRQIANQAVMTLKEKFDQHDEPTMG